MRHFLRHSLFFGVWQPRSGRPEQHLASLLRPKTACRANWFNSGTVPVSTWEGTELKANIKLLTAIKYARILSVTVAGFFLGRRGPLY